MLELNLIGANVTIEKRDYGTSSTIHIIGQGTDFLIHIDKSNLDYLRQKLNPQGLIPDDFQMKIHMMNEIAEDIGPIYDRNQTDYCISKFTYENDEDAVFFDCEGVL